VISTATTDNNGLPGQHRPQMAWHSVILIWPVVAA
jgi:hypothetical protein